MPNSDNIIRPISLVACPRSGTSLLFRALRNHPDVDAVGETANFIFTGWRAVEQMRGLTRFGKAECDDQAADVVRYAFLRVFHSDSAEWMHKPIGVPKAFWEMKIDIDRFAAWYWRAFYRAFPDSRTFTIVRHPHDVLLSAREYFGSDDASSWRIQRDMYTILAHEGADLRHIVVYEDLVRRPRQTMQRLADAVGLSFHQRMLGAFKRLLVQQRDGPRLGSEADLEAKKQRNFSRKEQWSTITKSPHAQEVLHRYESFVSLSRQDRAGREAHAEALSDST